MTLSARPTTTAVTGHKVVALRDGELQRPDTAWPTVGLAIGSFLLWASVAWWGSSRAWTSWATVPVSTLAVYMCFTPMHEAAHGTVSRRYRWLNEIVGWLCIAPFVIIPYSLWRWIHLQHHKHTNDPSLDPDHSDLPDDSNALLHMLAVLPNYLRHVVAQRGSITCDCWLHAALYWFMVVAALALGTCQGFGRSLLQFWIAPALFAMIACIYVFDYVPHHPVVATRRESLYACTSVVGGFFSPGEGSSSWLLTCLLFGQNYHAIHHIYPTMPFYSYRKLWESHQGAFVKAGVPIVALLQ